MDFLIPDEDHDIQSRIYASNVTAHSGAIYNIINIPEPSAFQLAILGLLAALRRSPRPER